MIEPMHLSLHKSWGPKSEVEAPFSVPKNDYGLSNECSDSKQLKMRKMYALNFSVA